MTSIQVLALIVLVDTVAGTSDQQPNRDQVEQHFRAGQQAMGEGRFDQAVQEFGKALRLDPELGQARINLGLALHLRGDFRRAVTELQEGLKHDPDVLGANVVLGVDELKLGFPSRAIPPLRRALKLDPSNQEALYQLGVAYDALGNYFEASRAYRTAFARGSKQADDWLRLGEAYLQMSAQLVARLVRHFQDTVWHERLAGDLLSERQLWNDAARRYKLAVARDPHQPGLHSSLGRTLLEQGKLEEGASEFHSELQSSPGHPPALLGLAEIELAQGQVLGALAHIRETAEISPSFLAHQSNFPIAKLPSSAAARMLSQLVEARPEAGVHFLLATLYSSTGQTTLMHEQQLALQSALEQIRKGEAESDGPRSSDCKAGHYEACIRRLEREPDLDRARYIALGEAHFSLGEYEEASDAFASALDRRSSDPSATYWLGRTYLELADRCFDQLAGAFPNSPQAHQLRAESSRTRGADEEAIKEYRLAAQIQPENPAFHEALGELYLKLHNLPAAEPELERALKIDPTRARSLYLMGRALLGKRQPEEAIRVLKKSLQYDPDLLPARAILGMAYLRAGRLELAVKELEQSASLDYYGDLHYMLFQAYRGLGKTEQAKKTLATSQAMRQKTAAADLARVSSLE